MELGDVEEALNRYDQVRRCTVALHGEDGDRRRLVAYAVADGPPSPVTLRRFLRERLPDYMIPSDFVFLDALPLTAAGKVDRRALPAPDDSRPRLEADYVAPRTPNEEVLAAIWSEVLKLDKVGIHDNFFDLGGHSLLATQVISRVRKAFELDIPLRALFESPTVAGLSALIVQSQAEGLGEEELAQFLAEAQANGR